MNNTKQARVRKQFANKIADVLIGADAQWVAVSKWVINQFIREDKKVSQSKVIDLWHLTYKQHVLPLATDPNYRAQHVYNCKADVEGYINDTLKDFPKSKVIFDSDSTKSQAKKQATRNANKKSAKQGKAKASTDHVISFPKKLSKAQALEYVIGRLDRLYKK